MMALHVNEYLDPGVNGKNVKYWLSGKKDSQKAAVGNSVKQGRPRTLSPPEEFFLVMCRLRQGFAEVHLAHLFTVQMYHSLLQVEYLFLGLILCI